jgi:hypothetical protein
MPDDLPELRLTCVKESTQPKSSNRLPCWYAFGVDRLDKLFFAIMAGSLVFLLAMSAFIISL